MKTPIMFFEELTAIPRASGQEKGVCDYLENFARERGLAFRRDAMHNAVIKKPASQGVKCGALMLQAHVDIVPVKDDGAQHDFSKDPVRIIKEGDIWRADGTTLGGDNGLGVAMILALLDDANAAHPALECVFTAQEEIGLNGAAALDVSDITAKRLINLDCGGEGYFCTSCAGGVRAKATKNVQRENAPGRYFALEVSGLMGGHSGGDIGKGRANAIRVLAGALNELSQSHGARLVSMAGGGKDNVIPSQCRAVFVCEGDPTPAIRKIEERYSAQYPADPGLALALAEQTGGEPPLSLADEKAVLSLLLLAPCGVRGLIPGRPDMVETSGNVANVLLEGGDLRVCLSFRSANKQSKMALLNELRLLCGLTGADMTYDSEYPGWAYQPQSPLRSLVERVYKRQTGKEAEFFGTHGGLECGLFVDKLPGADAIAMGAESGDVHSTKEWMSVSSLERTYAFLCALAAEMANELAE